MVVVCARSSSSISYHAYRSFLFPFFSLSLFYAPLIVADQIFLRILTNLVSYLGHARKMRGGNLYRSGRKLTSVAKSVASRNLRAT